MTPKDAFRIMLLCLAASGCAGPDAVATSGQLVNTDPPDDKKVVEFVNAAFKTAKLSGVPEASPVHPAKAPQPGDWMFCIKSVGADDQPKYAVFVKNGAIVDVRSYVLLDHCGTETYHSVEMINQPAVTIDGHGAPTAKPSRHRHT